jgi:hypothetical protein
MDIKGIIQIVLVIMNVDRSIICPVGAKNDSHCQLKQKSRRWLLDEI